MHRVLTLALTVLLGLTAGAWAAPSKQYIAPETILYIGDSGQTPTPTAVMQLSALPSGNGRVSAQIDRGAGSIAADYVWNCTLQLTGTNIVGAVIEWYVIPSNGTSVVGSVGTADAALTTDKRNNLWPIGVTIVDQTTTNTSIVASGIVRIPSRYFSWGIWDATTLPLRTDTTVHKCTLTPVPSEQQ